jgi:hypothetical protein
MEKWKDVPGYEGYYQVSDIGNVKSMSRLIQRIYKNKTPSCFFSKEKILKPVRKSKGYYHLTLHKDGIAKQATIHRLVMSAFSGVSSMEINHKDGIKANNVLENLEYCDRKHNVRHSFKLGLNKPRTLRGEKNPMSKLSKQDVMQIKKLISQGISQKKIGDMFGVAQTSIHNIHKKKTWF